MKYNFDVISDIHLDCYLDRRSSKLEMQLDITYLVESLLPEEKSDILIIAGDLGHHNSQNELFLLEVKKYYEHVVLVSGNHDYYLVSRSSEIQYNFDSKQRISDMKEKASRINGVHYLDGDIVEIDGIKFGGVGMWYDFEYGIQVLNEHRRKHIYNLWKKVMNDSNYIHGLDFGIEFNEFNKEKEKLDQIIDQIDVIITHVSPDWSKIENQYSYDLASSFFYFDGKSYFNKIKNKIWISGHTHSRKDYNLNGCRFINASFGYPHESMYRKIINVSNS